MQLKTQWTTPLLGAGLALTLSTSAFAAGKSVNVHPIALAIGMYSGTYEAAISSSDTLTIGGMYWNPTIDQTHATVLDGRIGARHYVRGEALSGFYLGAGAEGRMAHATDGTSGERSTQDLVGARGEAGFRWVESNGFSQNLGAYLRLPVVTYEDAATHWGGPLQTGLDFSIGYAW